jgi:hypothetical protein
VANRLLRTYGEAIGLDPDFTVMDQSDAEDLMDVHRHNPLELSQTAFVQRHRSGNAS